MMSIIKRLLNTQNNITAFVLIEFKKQTLLYSLLCAIFSLCMTPSPGISRGEDPRSKDQKSIKEESFDKNIWDQAMAQDPDEWSNELKKKLLRLKPDSTIEELAEGIRNRQLHAKIRDAVENGEMTPEEAKQRLDRLAPPTISEDEEVELPRDNLNLLPLIEMEDASNNTIPLKIIDAYVKRDMLAIKISYTGGCRSHEFQLLDTGIATRSIPPQHLLRLVHVLSDDSCEALLTTTLFFDLLPLKIKYENLGSVAIRLEGLDGMPLYSWGQNNPDKDSEIEKFRQGVLARAKMQDPGEWSDELKAAIVRAGWNIEEIAEKFHGDKSKINDKNLEKEKLQKFREGVLVRAMAQSPKEWSDELNAAIKKAGWNVKELAARILKHQEEERNGTRSKSTDFTSLISDLDTAVEERSWGQIKKELVP